jgi:hypothetical protein
LITSATASGREIMITVVAKRSKKTGKRRRGEGDGARGNRVGRDEFLVREQS